MESDILFSVLAQASGAIDTGFLNNISVLAQASGAIDTGFLNNIKKLWCNLMSKSGPIVPIVSGAALAVFAVLFVLDEGKGYVSTALRILLGIAILVFIPSLLSNAFGISMDCGSSTLSVQPVFP